MAHSGHGGTHAWRPPFRCNADRTPKQRPPRDLLRTPRRERLTPLLGRIEIADMRAANLRASGNDAGSSPASVARWLWQKIGGRWQSLGDADCLSPHLLPLE